MSNLKKAIELLEAGKKRFETFDFLLPVYVLGAKQYDEAMSILHQLDVEPSEFVKNFRELLKEPLTGNKESDVKLLQSIWGKAHKACNLIELLKVENEALKKKLEKKNENTGIYEYKS